MADGLNKDVLQDISDKQKEVAAAAPEPVNEPDPVEPTEPAKTAAPKAAVKKDPPAK